MTLNIESFLNDSSNNFVKDYDNAAYEHNTYMHRHTRRYISPPKPHQKNDTIQEKTTEEKIIEEKPKEWFETEQGLIYITAGVVGLIGIVIILSQLRKK